MSPSSAEWCCVLILIVPTGFFSRFCSTGMFSTQLLHKPILNGSHVESHNALRHFMYVVKCKISCMASILYHLWKSNFKHHISYIIFIDIDISNLYTYPLIKYYNTISQITCIKKKQYLVYHNIYIYTYTLYLHISLSYIIFYTTHSMFTTHPLHCLRVFRHFSFLSAPPTGKLDVDREIHHLSTCLGSDSRWESQKPWMLFSVDWFLNH